MLKVQESNVKNNLGNYIEYVLENGIELYLIDWNGEVYLNGYLRKDKQGENTGYRYKPVYKEVGENQFILLGFEELI